MTERQIDIEEAIEAAKASASETQKAKSDASPE